MDRPEGRIEHSAALGVAAFLLVSLPAAFGICAVRPARRLCDVGCGIPTCVTQFVPYDGFRRDGLQQSALCPVDFETRVGSLARLVCQVEGLSFPFQE